MNTIPAALNAIMGQVQNYSAPEQIIRPDSDCKLTYEILQWAKTHLDGLTDDRSIGTVEISRFKKGNETEYGIIEKRQGGSEELYEATVTTTQNDNFGESIQNWVLDWHQPERPDNILNVSGTVRGETLEIGGTTGQRQIPVTSPALCPWIIPFVLAHRGLDTQLSEAFTSIDELTYCKPNQLLHGPDHIQTEGEPLAAFRHTGPATLPIHYVFDSQGRPVFVTFTMLSWILRAIDLSKKP